MLTSDLSKSLAVALFAVVAAPSQPAAAEVPGISRVQEIGDTRTVRVSRHDLDLYQEAGVKTLNRRIKRAARIVCQLDTWPRTITAERCYRLTLSRAKGDMQLAIAEVRGDRRVASAQ